jgi:hypothetical protein
VPAREPADGGPAPDVFARFRAHDWIGITHRADSLDLIQDMITAGLGGGTAVELPGNRGLAAWSASSG